MNNASKGRRFPTWFVITAPLPHILALDNALDRIAL
jgi:hypothetical protein